MGGGKQFILSILQKSGSLGLVATTVGIESSPEVGGLFNEKFTIDRPTRQDFEGVAVQLSNLKRRVFYALVSFLADEQMNVTLKSI